MDSKENSRNVSLRVSETDPKFVGRGIALVDPKVMIELGLSTGGVIEISGNRRKTHANRLHFTVKVPFTEEKDLDITRFGSEVIIKIKSATGYLVNVIPLPMITYNMEMLQVNLDNNVLNIIFEKKF
jgi:hypothetical protein